MKFVIDNNILFSVMNPFSIASFLISSIRTEFFAPKFIKTELEKYKEECLFKSNLSEHEFEIRQIEIEESISFSEEFEYDKLLEKAIKNLPDPKDSPYLALALSINSTIWSNDPHLKQQLLVPVFTTAELAKFFLKGKI